MIFGDIPLGGSVFVDANALVYHFAVDPLYGPPCTDLMERIERQEINGVTSTHVLSETAHRLMTLEASQVFGWPMPGIAYRLAGHPAEVRKLKKFQQAVDEILSSRIRVLTVDPRLISTAAVISRNTGLLSNDALIVAVMPAHGLTELASNDTDFDRVPGLTRYAPA
jgi:predicted nucleic acid-binding protein